MWKKRKIDETNTKKQCEKNAKSMKKNIQTMWKKRKIDEKTQKTMWKKRKIDETTQKQREGGHKILGRDELHHVQRGEPSTK